MQRCAARGASLDVVQRSRRRCDSQTHIYDRPRRLFFKTGRERAYSRLTTPPRADLRQDADGQDHHARRRAVGHDRQREAEDPGQGGYPARPAAPHLRRQAARGRPHVVGLQHPEGVDPPLSTETERRRPRPFVVDDGRELGF